MNIGPINYAVREAAKNFRGGEGVCGSNIDLLDNAFPPKKIKHFDASLPKFEIFVRPLSKSFIMVKLSHKTPKICLPSPEKCIPPPKFLVASLALS